LGKRAEPYGKQRKNKPKPHSRRNLSDIVQFGVH
jgi:hypothetical protein